MNHMTGSRHVQYPGHRVDWEGESSWNGKDLMELSFRRVVNGITIKNRIVENYVLEV